VLVYLTPLRTVLVAEQTPRGFTLGIVSARPLSMEGQSALLSNYQQLDYQPEYHKQYTAIVVTVYVCLPRRDLNPEWLKL
jgi:hypothetical protein